MGGEKERGGGRKEGRKGLKTNFAFVPVFPRAGFGGGASGIIC